MNGEWFLWGGFVFSLLWHLVSWLQHYNFKDEWKGTTDGYIADVLKYIQFGLSGVSLNAFGYLVF